MATLLERAVQEKSRRAFIASAEEEKARRESPEELLGTDLAPEFDFPDLRQVEVSQITDPNQLPPFNQEENLRNIAEAEDIARMSAGVDERGIIRDIKTVVEATKIILNQPGQPGEIQKRIKNIATRAISPLALVIPGVSRRQLIAELDKEAETFTGFGPAIVPAAGQAAQLTVEWTGFQKVFGLTHQGFSALGKIQRVRKLGEAIKSFKSVKAFAERFPRIFAANRDLIRAFAEGETIGQTVGLLEGLDEGETAGNILKIMNIRGATLGGIAATFSLASSIDTTVYVNQFRTSLIKNIQGQ